MPIYKSRSIIIRTTNLRESDKIVTAFTEKYGKISGVARGSRKIKSRFTGNLESINHTHIIYFGKENTNLFSINSLETIHSYPKIKNDLIKVSTAMCMMELLDTLVKESYVNKALFQLVINAISLLEQCPSPIHLLRIFEIRLMAILGYRPRLNSCGLCNAIGEENLTGFDFERKSVICRNCRTKNFNTKVLNAGTIKFLEKAMTFQVEKIDRLKIPQSLENEITNFTHKYIQSHTNRELKSYHFMKKINR